MSASDKKKLRKEQESAALTEKQLAQKKEDKQLKSYTMTFIVVMILVVAIAVASLGSTWYQNSGIPSRSTVALTIGDSELSNTDLNYYYIDTINNFYTSLYEQYSAYTTLYAQAYYGLDMTQPLNTQIYSEETGETWADYFLESAIETAKGTYALYNQAVAEGFEMSEDFETELNAALASTRTLAGYYGYSNMEDYLKAQYGNGADEESFVNYYTVTAMADAYYSNYAETLMYSPEDIETYNTENYNNFSIFDYVYFYVNINDYMPDEETEDTGDTAEDATEPTEGEESTSDRDAAVAAAKADADWLAEAQTRLVMNKKISQLEYAEDGDEVEVIEGTTIGSVATLYSEWIGDPARQAGDTTVVEYESTTDDDELVDGYYVVMFEGREDYNDLMRSARHMLVMFEGGTTVDGVTVYSDEEKAAAYEKAETTYNQWLNGDANEESFAALVSAETSDDTGSNTNGGLYTNIYRGQMVQNFNDWVFDAARQPGDHAIIETEIGYHIMYFVEEQDQTYREYCIEYTLRSADVLDWYEALLEGVTVTEGDTSHISKSLVIAPETSTTTLS